MAVIPVLWRAVSAYRGIEEEEMADVEETEPTGKERHIMITKTEILTRTATETETQTAVGALVNND